MSNVNQQFSINLPNDWKETTVFTFEGPQINGIPQNLVLVIDPEFDSPIDVETYALIQLEQLKNTLPGFEMIQQKMKRLNHGLIGYEITYKYIPTDRIAMYQKQVFVIWRKKAYTFTSSYSKKSLKMVGHIIDNMIFSFLPDTHLLREIQNNRN